MRSGYAREVLVRLSSHVRELLCDERGLTSLEYALLLALISTGTFVCFHGLQETTSFSATRGSHAIAATYPSHHPVIPSAGGAAAPP